MKNPTGFLRGGGRSALCLPFLLFLLPGCLDPSVPYDQDTHYLLSREAFIQFSIDDRAELDELTRIVSIKDVRNGQVWAYAYPHQLEKLHSLGYSWTQLPHPGFNPDVRMGFLDEYGNKIWNSYPTYSEYVDVMQQFADDYPNLCRLYDIGDGTNQNRPHDLWAIKITDNPDVEEDEPEVFYTASMHGDETCGYIMMLYLIEELLTKYGSDTQVTNLVDNLEIWINPLANPDGCYYGGDSSVGSAIRSYTTSSGSSSGVDPNRNFPDPVAGNHPDGNSWWRETVAMMDFADAHSLVISANFHGGAELVNYPWDSTYTRHPDNAWYIAVSREYADNCQNDGGSSYMNDMNDGITNGADWYVVYGGRQDYMNAWHGCREVTIELSSSWTPSGSSLDGYWQANRNALLDYIENALSGIRGTVTNQALVPLPATVEVLGVDTEDSYVFTDPETGDYHRMLLPGTYDLRFTSTGYLDQDVLTITVSMGDATRVDVIMEALPCSSDADCDLLHVNQHVCNDGVCEIVTCDPGWGDCNQIDSDGCEEDLTSDPANCGACNNVCDLPNAVEVCSVGVCLIDSCEGDYLDCNTIAADGCEAHLDVDPQNCGACGTVCVFPHASSACQSGNCVLGACDDLWGNCDGNPSNGCEADLSDDIANCGACLNVCQVPNATSQCTQGVCTVVNCNAPYQDCNGLPQDGCEADVQTDLDNCGVCANACDFANAESSCASGVCQMGACHQGFENCNLNNADGCEAGTSSDPLNCGGCGLTCDFANADSTCMNGTCLLGECHDSFANCNGNPADGCEANLAGDPNHCGQCNNSCDLAGGNYVCVQGVCELSDCDPGTGDCNNNDADGCETDLQNDPLNCGFCGNRCGSGQTCREGACQSPCHDIDGDGYQDHNCGGDDCNDTEAAFNPGATEICNHIDDDCNGLIDDGIECEKITSCGCSTSRPAGASILILFALLGLVRGRKP